MDVSRHVISIDTSTFWEVEDKDTATTWCGSIPKASGWATNPSMLLLDLLAMVVDESSQCLAT